MTISAKEQFAQQAKLILEPYKIRFEEHMLKAFAAFGPKNKAKEAMEYALMGSSKRFRPALVYMVADALKKEVDVTPCALAVEYFHTASLLADDLPCMDDDDYRRGRLTAHKVYGENIALLASYALIASGFEEIAKNPGVSAAISRLGILEASRQMGIMGLIGGQVHDLYPQKLDREEILKIFDMKTCALFDLSMSLGWLFGGGNPEKLPVVHRSAYHFGCAFQILDDLDDREQDAKIQKNINYANLFGTQEAIQAVHQNIDEFKYGLTQLQLASSPLTQLGEGLKALSATFQ